MDTSNKGGCMNEINVNRIITLCGGAQHVAKKMGMKPASVHMWSHKKVIPPKRVTQLKEFFPHVITDEVFALLVADQRG